MPTVGPDPHPAAWEDLGEAWVGPPLPKTLSAQTASREWERE
jgi:hypothetical protein